MYVDGYYADFWLTMGRFAEQFEAQFAKYMGFRFASLVNGGSSANLPAPAPGSKPSWFGFLLTLKPELTAML